MKRNKKGFTLAELLIVVAIIAVLVAIAIPVFSKQLESAREGTDAANIRSNYAKVMTAIIMDGQLKDAASYNVPFQQKQDGWQNADASAGLGALSTADTVPDGETVVTFSGTLGAVTNGGSAAFAYSNASETGGNPKLTITLS